MNGRTVLHLLPLSAYEADTDAPITSPTLATQGFVHCSPDVHSTLAVANTLFLDSTETMVAIEFDTARLSAAVRWEAADPAPPAGVADDILFPHVYGTIDRTAITGVRYARRDCTGRYVDLARRGPTAAEFDLLPHPTGGWSGPTWSGQDTRASYFVLGAGETSQWHEMASDELWLWHRGPALTLELGGNGVRPTTPSESLTVGPSAPQVVVPAGAWRRATGSPTAETLLTRVLGR